MTIERAIREDAHDVDQGMDGVDDDFDDIERGFLDAEFGDGGDKRSPSREQREEEADEADEVDPSEGDEDEQEADEVDPEDEAEDAATKETPKAKTAADDDEIVTTVDGKEVRATVKDVRRLVGQEAKLTQRSMQVAEKDRSVSDQLDFLVGAIAPIKAAAEARWKDYKDTNLYLAAQDMDRDTFKVFQADYEQAKADIEYVQDMEGKIGRLAEFRKDAAFGEAVTAAHAAINDKDSPVHIEGWNQDYYKGLMSFAEGELKLDPKELDRKTDPLVFKLLSMVKASADAKKKAAALRDKAKGSRPAVPTTTRVKVTTPGSSNPRQKGEVDTTALGRLKKTGKPKHADAIFEAFID